MSLINIAASHTPFNVLRILMYKFGGTDIGKGTKISRHVKIGPKVKIGDRTKILPRSKLHHCDIGDEVMINECVVLRYIKVGNGSIIDKCSQAYGIKSNWVKMGDEVAVGVNWILDGTGGLEIEDHVNLASHLGGIFTHSGLKNRLLGRSCKNTDGLERSPVKIGRCSWIGGTVTIQPGVSIGHHSAVLPNSSVAKDITSYTLAGGVPAKPIKQIKIEGENIRFEPPKLT